MSEKKENVVEVTAETYSVDDIVNATEALFGSKYKPFLVAAALKGVTGRLTKDEAVAKVKAFAERKVGR